MIKHVVAKSLNNVIGIDNNLPWYLPEDLKHFKEVTLGHTIYMGSNTFRSIIEYAKGYEILPGRNIIVITQTPAKAQKLIDDLGLDSSNVSYWTKPILDHYIKENPKKEVMIVGGAKLYEAYPPDVVIATEVQLNIEEGNKYYNWDLTSKDFLCTSSSYNTSKSDIDYSVKTYTKVQDDAI